MPPVQIRYLTLFFVIAMIIGLAYIGYRNQQGKPVETNVPSIVAARNPEPKGPYNILVTGGAGFIGSHLVEHFSQFEKDCGYIYVLDDLSSGKAENIQGLERVELIQGSITDKKVVDDVMSKNIRYIFHFGAKISVFESFAQPIDYTNVNTIGTLNLLNSAKQHGIRSFVFSSSSAVYGNGDGSARREDEVPNPISPYGKTKLDGEFYIQQWSGDNRFGISLRYYNVFGERQEGAKPGSAAIPAMIHKALNGSPLSINGDGEQTRDFIYVKDVVSANVYAAKSLHSGVYNVGYEKDITLNKLADSIISKCQSKSVVEHGPGKQGDIRKSIASTTKIRKQGWVPTYSLEKGLENTIAWTKKTLGK